MKKILILIIFLLTTSFVYADHPSSIDDPNRKVEISFVFPNGKINKESFSYLDITNILLKKPLPENIHVDTYKIDWWVYGALQHFNLPFEVRTEGKTGLWKSVITRIDKYSNGGEGSWVYFVNDIKSKYHISTQTDQGLKRIEFVFNKTK